MTAILLAKFALQIYPAKFLPLHSMQFWQCKVTREFWCYSQQKKKHNGIWHHNRMDWCKLNGRGKAEEEERMRFTFWPSRGYIHWYKVNSVNFNFNFLCIDPILYRFHSPGLWGKCHKIKWLDDDSWSMNTTKPKLLSNQGIVFYCGWNNGIYSWSRILCFWMDGCIGRKTRYYLMQPRNK